MKLRKMILPIVMCLAMTFTSLAAEPTYLGKYKVTYYCSCSKCNGKWGAIDGFGNPLVWGTIATDNSVIPMNTNLAIEGYPDTVFTVRDNGGGVNGDHIDMFVPVSHKEAYNMGVNYLDVWKFN